MATTTTSSSTPQHLVSNHHQHPYIAAASPAPAADHLNNMLSLRDVVFISPPPPLHHQPSHQQSAGVGLGVSIFPLLPCLPSAATATPTTNTSAAVASLDFQVHPQFQANRLNDDNMASQLWSFSRKDAFSCGHQDDGDQSLSGRGAMPKVCRDCGNRPKKECAHQRCRTCCKSRGYDCPTHEKSTWVPAAKRREKHLQGRSRSIGQIPGQGQPLVAGFSSSFSTGLAKRPRLENASVAATVSSASNIAIPSSFDTISCPQDVNFKRSLPGKVKAPAVFKCIRVTTISDNAAEFVYQATVSVSGHVFKGFLYDQGMEGSKSVIREVSELHFEEVDRGSRDDANDSSPVSPDPTFFTSGCQRLPEGERDK
ncbi:hypothetical protein MLD38_002749 [Melastoma candidum]|uniref:Uncharacterized protein n=1 Tax=Melastoma candidum TaxID=119954 RepID=A0ACB9S2B2_9MYRT|nr:hypothetical protein MLD38_002749 [Melastoma candidum]